jgi:hypothetical protein
MNLIATTRLCQKSTALKPAASPALVAPRRVPVTGGSPVEFLVGIRDLRRRMRRNWSQMES